MNESTPTPANSAKKHELGDINFLFDKNNPETFAKKIEASGYEVLSDREEKGERITRVVIPTGDHFFSFGFRQIDTAEQRWFHGGLDNQSRREESSFTFDTETTEFKRLSKEFALTVEPSDNLETIVSKLDMIIQREVQSDLREEDAHSLSEVVRAGRAACSSKTVLAGSILKEQYPTMRVETILGYYGTVKDTVSLPFGHEWLRVSDGQGAVLYDPMYKKVLYYPFDTEPKEVEPFSGYTVSALPFAKLHSTIGLVAMDQSLKLVAGHKNTAPELVISETHTVETQLGGLSTALVRTRGGVLTLVNGNISNEVSKGGPRLLYPLLHIEKYN